MDIFDLLNLIGGLCLFLFGMELMGSALERRAGSGLKTILAHLTHNKLAGFATGLGVTSIIQSSSATTVMVVGFVNSNLMTLRQAISIIMGANVGTTVTAWILSLGGISGDNLFMQLLKPTSFTPILALIGTVMYMFGKSSKGKDTATILLGFATLMFGMDTMSSAVSGLRDVAWFQQMFIMFKNPILGVIVGALLTAIIQSSSASVGILQALSATGQITLGAAIPIIMGQNIGTCITAILSSFGTNKNAKRAAVVHLSFNIIGTIVGLILYILVSSILKPVIFDSAANHVNIAVAHSFFNVMCTVILFPVPSLLEKIALKVIPETGKKEEIVELDNRLIATPAVAIAQCHKYVTEMAEKSVNSFKESLTLLENFDSKLAEKIRKDESRVDHLEDILGTYLVKLSAYQITDEDSAEVSKLLKAIGDFERISDHSVNVVESAEELHEKRIIFTDVASKDMNNLTSAVSEILDLASFAFIHNDTDVALKVEPLEQVIDELKLKMRNGHIDRLQKGECSIEAGFVLTDLITNLERTADHCSSIAVCIIDSAQKTMNIHESKADIKENSTYFKEKYISYSKKYLN